MNRRGHQGVGVLVLAGAAALLFYAGVVPVSRTALLLYLLTGAVVYWTASLPDQLERLLGVRHRTWLHSYLVLLLFAAGVFYAARTVTKRLNRLEDVFLGETVPIYVAIVLLFSTALHVSLDCFSKGGSYQTRPLYPVSNRGIGLSLYGSSSHRLNWLLHRLGTLAFLAVPGYWLGAHYALF